MTGCMTFGLPIFSLIWVVTLPAAIGVYWTVSSLCGFISQVILGYFYSPKKVLSRLMVEETIERRSKENHIKSITEIKEKKN
jgi:membrane protein insertase Oxa1/YidC/SpoIIIJ